MYDSPPLMPLVPAEVDLQGFLFMPLDVARLRDSELSVVATGDEFRAAILLWCAAWQQVPAASLPNNDPLLAKLAGYGRDLAGWLTVKTMALHGFVLCRDGRLYNPMIAEKALLAWEGRKRQQAKANARWHPAGDAAALPRQNHGNAGAMQGRGRVEKGRIHAG